MLFKTYCATCIGIDAVTVTVEVDLSDGIGLRLVGLPDNAVKESLLRVTTAILSYGFRIPGKRLVVNLAPADLRKEGSSYDLAIALGLLAVSKQISVPRCGDFLIMGELALDGGIRPVPGALPAAIHAAASGFRGCIFPKESAVEASDITGLEIYAVSSLSEAIDILAGDVDMSHLLMHPEVRETRRQDAGANDFKDVRGQKLARRGLEIAAAGSHNLLLIGAPGSGKTMMASCLPSILPPMTREESLETSKIYSVTGNSLGRVGLMRERPFRTPHHSSSLVSLVGGGSCAAPGEISLAHNGVLYCDEIAQFSKMVLDALRQPVEDGKVTISRARYKVTYPCSFMLVASMNPCPCGHYGDDTGLCKCTPGQIHNYLSRISGPMMDRLDLHVFCRNVPASELTDDADEEASPAIAARVSVAREIQLRRFAEEGIFTNSQMNTAQIRKYCRLDSSQKAFLKEAIDKLKLSARAYSRILKIARTIADLAGSVDIRQSDLAEALQFRSLDRSNLLE